MSKISLRAYIREIDSMVDQERLDEAIAHCRHILSKYPKHIDTYRLLGKAYLESNQNSNAADIFQRVLSAVPDDFVSHIGMSLIREEEGNLQSAVTHMERAFEKQPYNNAIQEEIRRLYGKRDGIEPPKVRLTQGSLARMYLKGGLISQGIAELRSALSDQPSRFDLRTLLAEAYQEADHMGKAIETASTILKKFPFNLVSNRILAHTLKTHDHPEEMAICRKRLYALSPYEAYVSEHAPTVEEVPDRAIEIERLDWSEFQEEFEAAPDETSIDWASALSAKKGASEEEEVEEEPVPEWLAGVEEEEASEEKEIEAEAEEMDTEEEIEAPLEEEPELPDALDEKEEPWGEPQAALEDTSKEVEMSETLEIEEETFEEEEEIPDWMAEVGWEASEGEAGEPEEIYKEEISMQDEELEPADIPDWLQPESPPSEEEISAEAEIEDTEEHIPSPEKPPQEMERLEEIDQEGVPEWLTEEPEPSPGMEAEDATEEGLLPREEAPEMEDIEDEEFAPAAFDEDFIERESEDFPDWLKDIKSDEDDQKTTVAWLNNLHEESPLEEEDVAAREGEDFIEPEPSPESMEDIEEPDWIKDLSQADSAQPPDLLRDEQEEGEEAEFPSLPFESPEDEAISEAPVEEGGETTDLWAEEPEDYDEDPISKFEMGEGLVSDQMEGGEEDFPDWLAKLDEAEDISEFELETRAEEGADFEWPIPSDEVEEEAGIPDEGLEFEEEPSPPSSETEFETLQEEEDIPGWLDMLDKEEEEEETWGEPQAEMEDAFEEADISKAPEIEEEAIEEEEEIPDWLAGIEPDLEKEVTERAPSAVEESEEEIITPEIKPEVEKPSAMPDLEDEDETMAWLESLATKQGADEEDFVTSAEERARVKPPQEEDEGLPEVTEEAELPKAEMPDWLSDLEPKEEVEAEDLKDTFIERKAPPESAEETVEEKEQIEEEGIPDWLEKLEPKDKEEVFEEPISEEGEQPVEEPAVEPGIETPPESIKEIEEEEEGIPDWLGELEKEEEEQEFEDLQPVSGEAEIEPPPGMDISGEEEDVSYSSAFTEEIEEEDMAWLRSLSQTGDLNLEDILSAKEKEEDISPQPEMEPDEDDLPEWFSKLDEEDRETREEDIFAPSDAGVEAEEKVKPLEEDEEEEEEEGMPDWLAELETAEDEAREFIEAEDELEVEDLAEAAPSEGMLKRLGEKERDEEAEVEEEEVPDWLVDFKEEEDPQETAVLWLRRFVERGKDVDVKEEINRYTDELDSDEIPEWMEDLKKEEDPTSTAMLWLNRLEREGKLRKEREAEEADEFDESNWIAELEKEQERLKSKETFEETEDFEIDEGDWLADLEREEQVEPKEEKDTPLVKDSEGEGKKPDQEETPPWMLATSPLEGDLLTSDLTQEEEEEIPEWLAGYEEEPEELGDEEIAEEEEDEYAWLSAYGDQKVQPGQIINLNEAAISQLESIIGISFQVAEGIVSYREEHGPFQSFEDLRDVPEIKDDQTIDILRAEVVLETPEVAKEAKQIEEKEREKVQPKAKEPAQSTLQIAREKMATGAIEEALASYEKLIEEKENIDQVIDDLSEATYDHPMNIPIIKTLGDAYMSIDKLQEALDAYSKAEDLLR